MNLRVLWSMTLAAGIGLGQSYRVEAIAGADHGRMGPGGNVLLRQPRDIIAGPAGSFFVSDGVDHRVLRLGPDFTASLAAGSGQCCFLGDDGPAADASVGSPEGLAFDSVRNRLYIAQPQFGRVRAVDLVTGKITTYAGNGSPYYPPNSDGQPATSVGMAPSSLTIDRSGNLYIGDRGNYRILVVDPVSKALRTFGGNGKKPILEYTDGQTATSIAMDPVYVAAAVDALVVRDGLNYRRIEYATGVVRTFLRLSGRTTSQDTGGFATVANLTMQKPLVEGSNVLIPSALMRKIYRFALNDSLDLSDLPTYLNWRQIAAYQVEGGSYQDIIAAFAMQGTTLLTIGNDERVGRLVGNQITSVLGLGRPGLADDPKTAFLQAPGGLAFGWNGELAIADEQNARLRILDARGTTLATPPAFLDYYTNITIGFKPLFYPRSVLQKKNGEWFIGTGTGVLRLTSDLRDLYNVAGDLRDPGFAGDGADPRQALLSDVRALIELPDLSVLVADYANRRIRRISPDGKSITTIAGTGSEVFRPGSSPLLTSFAPADMALGPDGKIYIADDINHRIYRFDRTVAKIESIAGLGGPGFSGELGPAGQARLNGPTGIAISQNGEIYVADRQNLCIRKISTDGMIRTIAGNSNLAATGDGGPALNASMAPTKLAISPTGDIYFTDGNFHKLRRLVLTAPATPAPQISSGGVLSLGSGLSRAAAGGLVSIYGKDLAARPAAASSAPLPEVLGGVTALLAGRVMPLLYVSPTQVNAQVPVDMPVGRFELKLAREDNPGDGKASNGVTVEIVDSAPDVLPYGPQGRTVAIDESGGLIGPGNGAKPGSVIVVFLTGIGRTEAIVPSGAASPSAPLALAVGERGAIIGGIEMNVQFLGLAPGFVGLAQANLELPKTVPPGDHELLLRLRGSTSNATLVRVD